MSGILACLLFCCCLVEPKLGECSTRDSRQPFQAHMCLQRQPARTCSFARSVSIVIGKYLFLQCMVRSAG